MSLKDRIKGSVLYPWLIRMLYPSKIKIRKHNTLKVGYSIIKNCEFEVLGVNNSVIFEDVQLINATIKIFGNNNRLIIRKGSFISNGIFYIEDNGGLIEIGKDVSITAESHFSVIEGTSLIIGDECLFSTNVMLSTGDSHSVIDSATGRRINSSQDILIGNHVWFGHDATILKGVKIANNTVIGACAVVTKSIDTPNVAIGGNPAKIVKYNIDWNYDRI